MIKNIFNSCRSAKQAEDNLAFVISSPRSGSTWLERSLNAHPDIYATENRLFGQFCENWPDDEFTKSPRITLDAYVRAWFKVIDRSNLIGSTEANEDQVFIEFAKHVHRLERRMSGKKFIIDKITPYLGTSDEVLRLIKKFFPNAKLIHLHRDGRDVCTSGVFDWIRKIDAGTNRYKKYALGEDVTCERFFTDDDLENWSRYWIEPMQAWGNTGIRPDCSISYEAMKLNYESVLSSVFTVLKLKNTRSIRAACIDAGSFEKLSDGRCAGDEVATAKARKGVSGDWKNYFTKKDGLIFEQLSKGLLKECKYEDSKEWASLLNEKL